MARGSIKVGMNTLLGLSKLTSEPSRKHRFWLGVVLVLIILGSWLWEVHTDGFEFGNSVAHLVAALIALSIADRELAWGWFRRLSKSRGKNA